ncbi:general substrate transporter [Teratosphaeria nubilosa]|uniref:General substrate transporter n=1 Tax=Teratosphaeria nubilosa TaxID=161662 RepID=A0A6G1L434_9PEZI|nr:general substrate transporter [Teratosphaeria nubilosa]
MKPFSQPYTAFTSRMRGRGKHSAWIEYMITVCCGVGNILWGYDQGVMGGFLTSVPFGRNFPSIASSTGNSTLQGFTVAVYEIGCALGALSVIVGGDFVGRRLTVMVGQVVLIIGATLQFSSFTLSQLIVGRIVTGVGSGMAVAVLPTWNGECSKETNRGRAILWQLNVNIFGIALAYWIDYAVNRSQATVNTDWSWRFPLSLQVLFAAITILMCCYLPDSPRALVRAGRIDEARDVIDMLSVIEDPVIRAETTTKNLTLIERAICEEANVESRWTDIFTQGRPRFVQRLCLATISLCMLQISGINLITYYAPVVFQNTLGMSRNTALLVAGFNGLEYWLATFIPIPLIDKLGRRPLMLFAAVGQTVCMAVLSATIAYPGSKVAGYTATVFLFAFNTFFAIGFDGVPFLLPVELTPLQTRAKSVSIATGCFWLCNFFVVMISPVLISHIKYGTYILWTCTNLLFIPMIYFLIPETLNAALEDIDVLFENNPTWIIGPGSRRVLAKIVEDRQADEAVETQEGAKYLDKTNEVFGNGLTSEKRL